MDASNVNASGVAASDANMPDTAAASVEAVPDVAGAIRAAAMRLRGTGVDTPDHDARLLFAEACGVEPRDVDKALLIGDPLDADVVRFDAMVSRRAAREPLQYIVGHASFRYLDLKVGPGVFIPRPETETVVQAGLDWIERNGLYHPLVVDLCAGSGAIGLAVATEVPGAEVWAVEKSPEAYVWTERNRDLVARANPSAGYSYHLELADATSPLTLPQLDGRVDAVITNPPYVPLDDPPEQPEVRDHDPAMALYGGSADGTAIPALVVSRAARLLRPGGALVMEHDVTQGDALVARARMEGFAQARTENDWTGRPRFLFAER